jgi:hypothetical protein
MDALRQRFPDLVIENCAGGGTRMDFAIARHTHTWWMDDASEPAHRTRMHSSGAGYLFPMETLNSWVTESEYENLNGQDLPDPIVRAMFRSRMMGAIGISCRTTAWSDTVRGTVREELSFYKEHLRPLVKDGYLLHLLPQPDLFNPRHRAAPELGGIPAAIERWRGFRRARVPQSLHRRCAAGLPEGARSAGGLRADVRGWLNLHRDRRRPDGLRDQARLRPPLLIRAPGGARPVAVVLMGIVSSRLCQECGGNGQIARRRWPNPD